MARLIVGCGYLGLRVARRWLRAGHEVVAVTRSERQAGQLAEEGLRPMVANVTEPGFLARGLRRSPNLPDPSTWDVALWAVGWDRRSNVSLRDVYVAGIGHWIDDLPGTISRIIYVSSTGVYGQTGGQTVDESSPCHPVRSGGKACLAAEQLLGRSTWADRTVVLRLAGIYGAGRLPRLDDLRQGRPLPIEPLALINLVHVDDAARAVTTVADAPIDLPARFLVADGHPVRRRDFYECLADTAGAPAPRFAELNENGGSPRSRTGRSGAGGKRIDSSKLCRELGFEYQYLSYRDGLAAIGCDAGRSS